MLGNGLGQWLQQSKGQGQAFGGGSLQAAASPEGYAMTGLRHWSNSPLEAPQFLWRGDLSPLGCEAAP
ncbi:protein of unknown function [Pseudomonas mediterranea]